LILIKFIQDLIVDVEFYHKTDLFLAFMYFFSIKFEYCSKFVYRSGISTILIKQLKQLLYYL